MSQLWYHGQVLIMWKPSVLCESDISQPCDDVPGAYISREQCLAANMYAVWNLKLMSQVT